MPRAKSSALRAVRNTGAAATSLSSAATVLKPRSARIADDDARGTGRTILVVVRPLRPSSVWALARARALARSEGATLLFLCVLPPLRTADDTTPKRERVDRTLARVTQWLARRGGFPPHAKLLVRFGVETTEAARIAKATRAMAIVVGVRATAGREWVELARGSGLPVVIARPARRAREIVAASDFSHDGVPTLAWAIRLGLAAEARVSLVHNVDPRGASISRRAGLPLPRAAVSDVRDARMKKMETLARSAPVPCEMVLLETEDIIAGVAGVVASKRADVLVVGTHRKAKMDTASRLVTRIRATVLVVPLDPP